MNTNKPKSSVDNSITNRQLFEQNIDGLKRSLSTKSRRMSRITEIALVTNYYWTNPNPPNSNVTTTTAAKRFKLLKTINKQQQIQQYIETNNNIILHFVCFYINIYIFNVYVFALCSDINSIQLTPNIFFPFVCVCFSIDSLSYRNRVGLLSFIIVSLFD